MDIGPVLSTNTGIRTVDVGRSFHSSTFQFNLSRL